MTHFDVQEKDGKIFIIENTPCHIDGEPFRYEQGNETDAEFLCRELNDLTQAKMNLQEIMTIIHNIKHNNWKWSDLEDYIYKRTTIDELWNKYDDIHKMMSKLKKK